MSLSVWKGFHSLQLHNVNVNYMWTHSTNQPTGWANVLTKWWIFIRILGDSYQKTSSNRVKETTIIDWMMVPPTSDNADLVTQTLTVHLCRSELIRIKHWFSLSMYTKFAIFSQFLKIGRIDGGMEADLLKAIHSPGTHRSRSRDHSVLHFPFFNFVLFY